MFTITNQSYLKWRSNGENQNQQCNIPTVSRESICQPRYKIMQTFLQKNHISIFIKPICRQNRRIETQTKHNPNINTRKVSKVKTPYCTEIHK